MPARRILPYAVVGCLILLALVLVGSRIFGVASTQADGDACASTWIWHYARSETPVGLSIYRRLLAEMPPCVHACVVSTRPREVEARCALSASARPESHVDLVTVSEPLSEWARDRYIFFERDGRPHVLVPPRHSVQAHAHGDLQVPAALRALHPDLVVRVADFGLEGGDVVVLGSRVLIGVTSLLRNTSPFGMTPPEFLARVAAAFGREVLIVGQTARRVPYEHIDMFLTAVDDDTIVLGDPRLALDVFGDSAGSVQDRLSLGDLGSFHRARQIAVAEDYDAITSELRGFGFNVLRLPVLHGEPSPTNPTGVILNWNNVLLANCGERQFAFVPDYDLAPLDQRARDLWAKCGYEVVPIPSRSAIAIGGSLRCLTNVLPGHSRSHAHRRSPL